MTPQTPTGWILFAVMWLSGPITGYAASSLITSVWARERIRKADALIVAIFGTLTLISTSLLVFVEG
jgi:hypothetical protein